MNSTDQFDCEEWVQDFIDKSFLSRRQAQVAVRVRQGLSFEVIGDDLDLPAGQVEVHYERAREVAERGHRTYLLLYGPAEFHENINEYPDVKAELQHGLDVDAFSE